ncbi:hypothetical protein DESC_370153 [Desulfosarcina cetonica]|nr:hypothetical protein DESC_370153 [Desulfosarcina cetonica]
MAPGRIKYAIIYQNGINAKRSRRSGIGRREKGSHHGKKENDIHDGFRRVTRPPGTATFNRSACQGG